MKKKLTDRKGAALLIWILLVAVVVMVLIIVIPLLFDVDEDRAAAEDASHEQTCYDSAIMEGIGGGFEGVYDYFNKTFVGLDEHPYKVQAYGTTKAHQDCVILVKCKDFGDIQMSWISRQTLRERYR